MSDGKKILMLGWELPPHNSGGLGEACLGLARSLSEKGYKITFVLPKKVDLSYDFMDIVFANVSEGDTLLAKAYQSYQQWMKEAYLECAFPSDYLLGSKEYAEKIKDIILKVKPDLIHAHDWLTFPAAIVAKRVSNKPLIVHVHSTEFDRTGGNNPNPIVYRIEKEGLENADRVIVVSKHEGELIKNNYGIDTNKIDVVYNGATYFKKRDLPPILDYLKQSGHKVVLYFGRITLQKGPEYFVRAAKKVLEYDKKTIFVVAGSGDMLPQMINEALSLNILDKFVFTGFVRGDDRDRVYQSADVYVMPSISEPFGIVPLEAIANGVPVLISKQSGVSEVLNHALKVDFWDTDEIANKILSVLKYKSLSSDLKLESKKELNNISWDNAAKACSVVYQKFI